MALILFVLAGCAARYIANTWKPDHVLPDAYQRIMVVAIFPEKDSNLHKEIEKNMTASLQALG